MGRLGIDMALRIGLAAAVFVYFALSVEGYAARGGIYAILEACALVAIVAIGLGITMLAGELDLSVGSVAAVAGVLAIQLSGSGILTAIAVPTIIGAVYGVLQGYVIHKLGVSSLVVTLATLIAVRGVAFVLSGETTTTLAVEDLAMSTTLREQTFWVLSPFSITMIVVAVLAGLFLRYTRAGREIYAVGGARKESRAAGIPQGRPICIAFACSAGLAALAGSISSLRGASAAPGAHSTLLLAAVAGALIGGISLYGGRGRILGILVGVATLQFLLLGLALQGAQFWAANLATGAVLLGFLVVDLAGEESPVHQWALRRRAAAGSSSRAPALETGQPSA